MAGQGLVTGTRAPLRRAHRPGAAVTCAPIRETPLNHARRPLPVPSGNWRLRLIRWPRVGDRKRNERQDARGAHLPGWVYHDARTRNDRRIRGRCHQGIRQRRKYQGTAPGVAEHAGRGGVPARDGDAGGPAGPRRPVLRDDHAAGREAGHRGVQRSAGRARRRGAVRTGRRPVPARHAGRPHGPHRGHRREGALARVRGAGRFPRDPLVPGPAAERGRQAGRRPQPVRARGLGLRRGRSAARREFRARMPPVRYRWQ